MPRRVARSAPISVGNSWSKVRPTQSVKRWAFRPMGQSLRRRRALRPRRHVGLPGRTIGSALGCRCHSQLPDKISQLGSYGGGNHFGECEVVQVLDNPRARAVADVFGLQDGRVAFLSHCGSRGIGHTLAMGQFRALQHKFAEWDIPLPGTIANWSMHPWVLPKPTRTWTTWLWAPLCDAQSSVDQCFGSGCFLPKCSRYQEPVGLLH